MKRRMLAVVLGAFVVGAWTIGAQTAPKRPAAGAPPTADRADDVEIGDDVKDVPARDLHALGDPQRRYFLIGADPKAKAPAAGFGLLLVLPGGSGDANMTSFVRRVWKECCPKDLLVAELVSVHWPGTEVVWPTRYAKIAAAKFTTEEFVDAVLQDVVKEQKQKIDPARIYQLGWSSGGPAEYAIALQEKTPVTASYVAMSVFREKELESDLARAKGQAYFLDHSPDDTTCRFADAERAQARLKKEGAAVELVTYAGGHGWQGDAFGRLRQGLAWMEKNRAKPRRK